MAKKKHAKNHWFDGFPVNFHPFFIHFSWTFSLEDPAVRSFCWTMMTGIWSSIPVVLWWTSRPKLGSSCPDWFGLIWVISNTSTPSNSSNPPNKNLEKQWKTYLPKHPQAVNSVGFHPLVFGPYKIHKFHAVYPPARTPSASPVSLGPRRRCRSWPSCWEMRPATIPCCSWLRHRGDTFEKVELWWKYNPFCCVERDF